MTTSFTAVDLSKIPVPDIIEEISFEQTLSDMKTDLLGYDPELSIEENDPSYMILQAAAYRETLLRQRINNAVRAVLLPSATGTDLDNLGVFFKVTRKLITPEDTSTVPPTPAVYESDDDFRQRIQLSPEGFSVAGPEGAYIFHCLNADARVKGASVETPSFSQATIDPSIMAQLPPNSIVLQVDDAVGLASPMPGDVVLNILSNINDGTSPQDLLDTVYAYCSGEDKRPTTDRVNVRSATISNYSIEATLYFYNGPGSDEVLAQSQSAIEAYVANQHKLGLDITLSGVYAALHQPGVQRVDLTSPSENIVIDARTAPYCTGINLINGGVDE